MQIKPDSPHRRPCLKISILLFLGGFFIASYSIAQPPLATMGKAFDEQPGTEVWFRFEAREDSVLKQLSSTISIDFFDPHTRTVIANANPREFARFLEYDISYTLLTAPGNATDKSQFNMLSSVDMANISQWDFYPTYEAYESMMQQYEDLFPDLFEKVEILTLASGRKIIFGRITSNVDESHDRPRFMYTATIHGDETTGFNLMLRMIHYLLNNYDKNDEITWLLNNLEIWICPNENPDGTYTTDNSTVVGATRRNVNGIDLNRNYPNPVAMPAEPIQPETQAMMDLVEQYQFVMSANIHGGIECVNYPWDSWLSAEQTHADHFWWQYVSHEYADTARYYSPDGYMNPQGPSFQNGVTHGGDWYVVYGSRQDYMNYYAHQREFTLEISDTKLLPTTLLPAHWEYNYRALINYMKQSLYGIQGRITDINSGEPLRAVVSITGYDKDNSEVFSSEDHGRFSRPLAQGNYDLVITAPGYPAKNIPNVSVQNHQATWLDIEMGIYLSAPFSDAQFTLEFYPNPASGLVTVTGLNDVETLALYDIRGNLVWEYEVNNNEFAIDVSVLPPAVYILKAISPMGVAGSRLIVKP